MGPHANHETRKNTAAGLDPSRTTLELALCSSSGVVYHELAPGPGVASRLKALCGDDMIGVENPGTLGALTLLACREEEVKLVAINPVVSKRFREALSEDQTDRKDAAGLARCVQFLPRPRVMEVEDRQMAIHRWIALRQELVCEKTQTVNRLHAVLFATYGACYKRVCADLQTKKGLAFFTAFPSISTAAAHPRKAGHIVGKPLDWIREEGSYAPSHTRTCLEFEVRLLCDRVRQLKDQIQRLEQTLMPLCLKDTRYGLLKSLTGMGTVTVAKLLAVIPPLGQFAHVDAFTAFTGLAPRTIQSGGQPARTGKRKRFNRMAKSAFMALALTQIRLNPKAKAYYQRKRKEGKTHFSALQATARQIAKIVYSMLKHNRPYISPQTPLSTHALDIGK